MSGDQINKVDISQLSLLNGFEQFLIYQDGEITYARPLHGSVIVKHIPEKRFLCAVRFGFSLRNTLEEE